MGAFRQGAYEQCLLSTAQCTGGTWFSFELMMLLIFNFEIIMLQILTTNSLSQISGKTFFSLKFAKVNFLLVLLVV